MLLTLEYPIWIEFEILQRSNQVSADLDQCTESSSKVTVSAVKQLGQQTSAIKKHLHVNLSAGYPLKSSPRPSSSSGNNTKASSKENCGTSMSSDRMSGIIVPPNSLKVSKVPTIEDFSSGTVSESGFKLSPESSKGSSKESAGLSVLVEEDSEKIDTWERKKNSKEQIKISELIEENLSPSEPDDFQKDNVTQKSSLVLHSYVPGQNAQAPEWRPGQPSAHFCDLTPILECSETGVKLEPQGPQDTGNH